MPRTREQNEEIRQQRREAILKGALRVYADHGYAAADIGEVAERAGVARGLIYYYFKDKLTLFRELFQYMFERSNLWTKAQFESDRPAREQLESLVVSLYEGMLEQSDSTVFFIRMRHDLHSLFTEEEMQGFTWHHMHNRMITDVLERGMREGDVRRMNPGLLAMQFWGAVMHGLAYLQQRAQDMRAEGRTKDEIGAEIRPQVRDAVAACMNTVLA